MKVNLSSIQPSPHPVRSSWDEGKMEELAQSIREQGLIQPFKVRPANDKTEAYIAAIEKWGDGWADDTAINAYISIFGIDCEEDEDGNTYSPDEQYEIVYGHRRAEACRRAGLTEVDVIVEGVDDENALIQALIENLQREDMAPLDTARALKALKENTGWNSEEMSRRGIMNGRTIRTMLALLNEPEEIQQLITNASSGGELPEGTISPSHVRLVQNMDLDPGSKSRVLHKAAAEGLSRDQTRRVAESIAAAPSEPAKQRLLERPYSTIMHDPEFVRERAQEYGAHDPLWMERNPKKADADFQASPEVASIIDMMRRWLKSLADFRLASNAGKMSPEAGRFIARRVREFAHELTAWADDLEKIE